MLSVLVVTSCPTSFLTFSTCLGGEGSASLSWATNAEQALEQARLAPLDLVVVDDQSLGRDSAGLLCRLAALNPRINTAVSSTLDPADFRQAYKGLGTMGQLPLRPGRPEAQDLLRRLPRLAAGT